MKSKWIAIHTTIMLGLSSVLIPSVQAETTQEMEERKATIQDKRSDVEAGISEQENKIKSLQSQQESVEEQITRLEIKIAATTQKINEKNAEITKTKAEIEQLKIEIEELKEQIAIRNEILKERALAYQESGGDVNYIEVLLGATSFGDFIDRVGAVATIVEADQDILEQQEADQRELETKQAAVEKKLADLETMRADLEKIKNQQTVQKQQQAKLMAQLKEEEHHTHELKISLEEESVNLAAQETALQKAIELEKTRQAELAAAKRKAAEEAAARAARESKVTESSQSSENESESVSAAPAVSSGMFTRPSAGVVTSQMGPRWNKQHAGIDIAASGTVPVVSAADGVVSRSYYSDSYGHVVFITHSINGKQYTTVYAHLRSRDVSNGQVVAKGQQVGLMGNSGRSYGQHLHFELHNGPWNVSKSNAINPLDYISY